LLTFGITLFLIGSALSGLSQTMWQLILFRGLQGLARVPVPDRARVIGDLFSRPSAASTRACSVRLRDRLPRRPGLGGS